MERHRPLWHWFFPMCILQRLPAGKTSEDKSNWEAQSNPGTDNKPSSFLPQRTILSGVMRLVPTDSKFPSHILRRSDFQPCWSAGSLKNTHQVKSSAVRKLKVKTRFCAGNEIRTQNLQLSVRRVWRTPNFVFCALVLSTYQYRGRYLRFFDDGNLDSALDDMAGVDGSSRISNLTTKRHTPWKCFAREMLSHSDKKIHTGFPSFTVWERHYFWSNAFRHAMKRHRHQTTNSFSQFRTYRLLCWHDKWALKTLNLRTKFRFAILLLYTLTRFQWMNCLAHQNTISCSTTARGPWKQTPGNKANVSLGEPGHFPRSPMLWLNNGFILPREHWHTWWCWKFLMLKYGWVTHQTTQVGL